MSTIVDLKVGKGATIWMTGLPGAGKSTIASALTELFAAEGLAAYILDGDKLRTGLNADLGFDREARRENVRRVGEVARLFADAGIIAIAALISPYAEDRATVRARHAADEIPFFEAHIATPFEVCRVRDPKGLYAQSQTGALAGMTGIDDPYEPPASPDFKVSTEDRSPLESATELFDFVVIQLS